MTDWLDSPEYDRWRTNPNYQSPEDREFQRQRDAEKAFNTMYDYSVVTNYENCEFKPGDTVYYFDNDRPAVVIGVLDHMFGEVYVLLFDNKIEKATLDVLSKDPPTVVTDFTNCKYKPGDKVMYCEHKEFMVYEVFHAERWGYTYVLRSGKEVVRLNEHEDDASFEPFTEENGISPSIEEELFNRRFDNLPF